MIFNSLIYLFFLSITTTAYYFFPGKFRWIWLLIASIGYYLSFIPIFLSLVFGIVLINYFLAKWLAKSPDKNGNRFLTFIIVVNILILVFFKYFNILFPGNQLYLHNVDLFFKTDPINKMILPVGLSYLTFTVLGYQIEVKRRTIQPEKHLGYFSLYLLFFPKMAQGPIERPQKLIPQLHQFHPFNYKRVVEGLQLMIWGFFKKLVVADRLALYVNAVYGNNENHNGTTLVIATLFFAFQIYADFSGYTDIALGSAKLFGFDLTNNFKRPYFATSIKDFWTRWHITFSTWLRDYIFLPLAYFLAHKMQKSKYLNVSADKWIYMIAIMVTFAICGIWHGVGWTYLLWGILFGIYLTYSNWTKDLNKSIRNRSPFKIAASFYAFCKVIMTFVLVLFAWIFFRAGSLREAFSIVERIFTDRGQLFIGNWQILIYSIFGIVLLVSVEIYQEFFLTTNLLFTRRYWFMKQLVYAALIIIILLIGVFDGGQFIYFQY